MINHGPTVAPKNDSPKGSQKKKKFLKMSKSKSLFLGRFKGLERHGSMREPLEIVTASRMKNMVEIRQKNTYFATIFCF